MSILDVDSSYLSELYPGVRRQGLVDGERGALSLSVADLVLTPESRVATHVHPTEEAMVILEGQLEAVLGDQVVTVTSGQTVLAPAGVKHGFVNRSEAPARLMAIFPTSKVERTLVD